VKAVVERMHVELEARDEGGRTPLHLATDSGHLPVAALHLATDSGHLPVVQCLCEQGADKDARDTDGRTPLHFAAPGSPRCGAVSA